ncbi:sulfurtransferase TusA family protein [Lederbergia wuyishanensis]|uniref:TusA-related sulfurtransferase n=1 Tax=Lederbergia wuyishanensis TaxID=1347903 RepID=A0ABU0D3X7_9BACI|nr:sulfurtransferase TusA family protein [Lederbergia wuyishanensis]MCJ8007724.1 sulfurtransferase TusA family protein [Lederbergia wuyishanensis]MDQ0343113.1 TusA-related sulfurtransferase [Lederbergia wuyishanensis]
MNIAKTLDAKGLACPMPIVRTKKAIGELESGQILEVLTTDKGSKADITAWVGSQGHELVNMTEDDGIFTFYIKKN